jgi:hypothetical protein
VFGIPAYAATPFAALAGTSFAFSVAENISAADSSIQSQVLLNSIIENIGVDDVENDVGGNFFGSITETFTFDDSSTQQSAFLQTFSDGVTQADSIAIAAQFNISLAEDTTTETTQDIFFAFTDSLTENFGPADVLIIIRVFTDSIAEAITMADSTSSTSDHPATIAENVNMASGPTDAGWIKIPTTQSVTWTNVETSQ